MKRTVITRRHYGPTTLTAAPMGSGSVSYDNHEEPLLEVGQRVRVRTEHFDGDVTVSRVEPRQYGGYTYHFE